MVLLARGRLGRLLSYCIARSPSILGRPVNPVSTCSATVIFVRWFRSARAFCAISWLGALGSGPSFVSYLSFPLLGIGLCERIRLRHGRLLAFAGPDRYSSTPLSSLSKKDERRPRGTWNSLSLPVRRRGMKGALRRVQNRTSEGKQAQLPAETELMKTITQTLLWRYELERSWD